MGTDPLADTPTSWPVSRSNDLHRDGWVVALREDFIHRPGHEDHEPFRRLVVEHPGAVVILAIDEQDRVLCLRQYRHAARREFVELPAGLIDGEDEDPLDVARRELREEASLQAEHWSHLATTYASPGISSEQVHYYVATGLSHADRGDFELEHEEAEMVTFWAPFDELRAAVLDGRVTDSPVAVAVLMYDAKRRG
ncbi:NUDIX domain-containing protein [Nocardioides pacificus]